MSYGLRSILSVAIVVALGVAGVATYYYGLIPGIGGSAVEIGRASCRERVYVLV